ncbi:MAG TPA: POTRA domain-containing protein [Acidobacteriaceae bacterium]
MLEIRRVVVPLLTVAAMAVPASAQKFIPKKIRFAGTSADQAEMLAVSGLKPGSTITQPDIQAAAQKLLDTGMFSNIQFKFDGEDLTYMLTPETNLAPVGYTNFPWWDQAALNAAVAAKVPLFHGAVLPESGMQQAVADALTALLKEKGVTATVTGAPSQDLGSGKTQGIEYHIDAPPVQIGTVTFAGASAGWTELLAGIEKAAQGQAFDGATEATLRTALNAIYHRQGYLEMEMSGFAHDEPQVTDGKVVVPVRANIVEGAQYKVGALTLAGDVLITPADFAKTAKLHAGEVANEDLLRGTLAAVAYPYRAHGYLRAKIDATPRFDAANHTVNYAVTVEPGPVFHMGELSLVNLNDQQKADVLRLWPMREGDVYDATVATSFLLKNKNNLHSLDGWSGSWKAFEHEDTHIVDLVVTFHLDGTLR